MTEIKRKKTTTIQTTKKSQTDYIGQSKTAIKPVVLPVTPKPDTTSKPSSSLQNKPETKPTILPQAQNKSGIDTTAPAAPITPSAPVAPSPTPSSNSSADTTTTQPNSPQQQTEQPEEIIQHDNVDQPEETAQKKPDKPETPEKTKTPEEKEKYNQKIEDEVKNKPKLDVNAKDKAADSIEGKAARTEVANAEKVAAQRFSKAAMREKAAAAGKAIGAALKTALTFAIDFFGWPWLVGCVAIFLILMMIFGGVACSAANGYFGKTYPSAASSTSAPVTNIKALTTKPASGIAGVTNASGFHKFDYSNTTDKQFVDDGKADERLLTALKYLSDKHNRIAVSYIVDTYQNMPTDPESGADRDPQLVSNVSAHKDGLAADISQIDFVIKAKEIALTPCIDTSIGGILSGGLTGGLTGGTEPQLDIVYYDDQGSELLRQSCKGGAVAADNQPSREAIPIKVSWQDTKPTVTHVSNAPDESLTVDKEVFYSVYQPQARKKVNLVIQELLQFPYDAGSENRYKVTQLITFSKERDIIPFNTTLDKLYGASRPSNYGLFSMPESWAQVHVAY